MAARESMVSVVLPKMQTAPLRAFEHSGSPASESLQLYGKWKWSGLSLGY